MKTTSVITKESPSARSSAKGHESVNVDFKVSKTIIIAIASLSALVGIWGLICLATGCIMSGNLIDLGKEWFSAVTGLGR